MNSSYADLQIRPCNDLEEIRGHTSFARWRTTGEDPYFICEWPFPQSLTAGWYRVDTDFGDASPDAVFPQMYVDYGRGFNESDRVPMPSIGTKEFRRYSVIRFVEDVRALRFDPSAANIEFSFSRISIAKVSRAQAAYRMARALLGRMDSIGSKLSFVKECVEKLVDSGPRGLAELLVARYAFHGVSRNGDGRYIDWLSLYDAAPEERFENDGESGPLLSVVMPVYNTPERWLRKCIDSVKRQTYRSWEMCIVDDASTRSSVGRVLRGYAEEDVRIRIARRDRNGHISAASNDALQMARGDYVVLLDHDDELPPWALSDVARAISENPKWRLIYSDEDKIDEKGRRYDPYFKPDWNYELLLSQNFISHLGVYEARLLREIGGFRVGLEGSQDWDLALRCVERLKSDEVGHIPRVLYHWRSIAGSTALAVDEKDYVGAAGLKAVQDHLDRTGVHATAKSAGPGRVRVHRKLEGQVPKVSLIIPTKDKVGLLKMCIDSVLSRTEYTDYELLVVDNQSVEPETIEYLESIERDPRISVVRYDKPFNYSAINNFAASLAKGEILGLLNNDIEVESPSWLTEMVAEAIRPDIGAVGAMLLYPDGSIQHAGVILGMHGVAGHLYAGKPRSHPGQMGRALAVQELSAVTAACLLVKKSVFQQVGGLDEGLAVAFNDIDFCLRLKRAGYRNIWTPHAVLFHHESASRGYEDTPQKQARFNDEVRFMRERWGAILECDPAYNRNLSLGEEPFEPSFPPRPWTGGLVWSSVGLSSRI